MEAGNVLLSAFTERFNECFAALSLVKAQQDAKREVKVLTNSEKNG